MAAVFCSSCGGPLDASGVCQRGCQLGTVEGSTDITPPTRYGESAPPSSTTPPYAVPRFTRFSGMWNWGAFLLCPFWLINHGAVWLGIAYFVVSVIPFLGGLVALGMAIYFGIKGNDWAVQHRVFADEQQFVAVQNAWRNWGVIVTVLGIGLGIFAAIVLIMARGVSGVHAP